MSFMKRCCGHNSDSSSLTPRIKRMESLGGHAWVGTSSPLPRARWFRETIPRDVQNRAVQDSASWRRCRVVFTETRGRARDRGGASLLVEHQRVGGKLVRVHGEHAGDAADAALRGEARADQGLLGILGRGKGLVGWADRWVGACLGLGLVSCGTPSMPPRDNQEKTLTPPISSIHLWSTLPHTHTHKKKRTRDSRV